MQAAYLVIIAFSIWMIYDAIRRKVELHWYLIILFVPFGGFIYFFLVKLRDYDFRRLAMARAGEPAIDQLRHRANESPSIDNSLALADALEQRDRFEEAAAIYEHVLDANKQDVRALNGLARCRLGEGRANEASGLFEKVLEIDRTYADYSAALNYAEALWQEGREDDAIELLEALAGVTGRLNHRLAQAHYLSQVGKAEPAMSIVQGVLDELEAMSAPEQERNKKWARKAQSMLSRLQSRR